MAIGSRRVPRAPAEGADAASAWAFARAVGLEPKDAEVAVRAAWAAIAPETNRSALLVALGEVAASLKDLADEGPTRFARTFRSLSWPVQVVLWGGAVEAIPLSTIFSGLGPHASDVWDPSRQLLHAYVLEGARSARPECASALLRVAAHIEAASLRDPRDLDAHIAGCRSCQYGFPIRVAEELHLLAAPAGPPPPRLGRQLAADRDRLTAGLPLLVGTPRRQVPTRHVLALAGGAAALVAGALFVSQQGHGSHPPRVRVESAAAPLTSSVPAPNGLSNVRPTAPASAPFAASPLSATSSPAPPGGDAVAVAFGPQSDPQSGLQSGAQSGPQSGAPRGAARGLSPAGGASPAPSSASPSPSSAGLPAPAPGPDVLPFPTGQPAASPATTSAPDPPVPYIPPPLPTTAPPTTAPPTTAPPTTAPPTTAPPTTAPTTAPPTTAPPTTTTTTDPSTTAPPTTAPPTTTTTTAAAAMMPFVGAPLAVFVPALVLPLGARRRQRGRASRRR